MEIRMTNRADCGRTMRYLTDTTSNYLSFWKDENEHPNGEKNKWSDPVIVLTNYGNVFKLSYFNADLGWWQRPEKFEKGEHVEIWTEMPGGKEYPKNAIRGLK